MYVSLFKVVTSFRAQFPFLHGGMRNVQFFSFYLAIFKREEVERMTVVKCLLFCHKPKNMYYRNCIFFKCIYLKRSVSSETRRYSSCAKSENNKMFSKNVSKERLGQETTISLVSCHWNVTDKID